MLNPGAGGLNYALVNTIDLDLDKQNDLLVYDRIGQRILPFLARGLTGSKYYKYAPEYIEKFPKQANWILLKDYNCDAKKDIFYGSGSNVKVMTNISQNELEFQPFFNGDNIESHYFSGTSAIYSSSVNLPAIGDVDGDNGIDFLTYEVSGNRIEYHKSLTPCGIDFFEKELCWGHFTENGFYRPVAIGGCTPIKRKTQHTGSTLTMLDLNADGVKDILTGNVSYNDITALYNTGIPDSAYIGNQDTLFPAYDKALNLYSFPAITYEDVTFEGIPDMIASSFNNITGSSNINSVWMYKNKGNANNPIFSFTQEDFLQDEMIDLGEGAIPRLVDLNGDKLQYLIIANNAEYIPLTVDKTYFHYYMNTGTKSKPEFTIIDTNFLDIDAYRQGRSIVPSFGDQDDDGDQDMIIGTISGVLNYFENIGSATSPNFTLNIPVMKSFDVGGYAAPFLYDFDGDDDLDMIVGNERGHLYYFENFSKLSPDFTLKTDFFGAVDVKTLSLDQAQGHSVPYVVEVNNRAYLLVGSEKVGIVFFDSISEVLSKPPRVLGTLGDDTLSSSGSKQTPFGVSRDNGRNQFLLLASELQAQGLGYGYIRSIGFNILRSGNPTLSRGINIRMKNTAVSSLSAFEKDLTIVTDFKVVTLGLGWNQIDLEQSFLWDGSSNLVIEICFSSHIPTSPDIPVETSNTSFPSNAYNVSGNFSQKGCKLAFDNAITRRPNIKLEFIPTLVERDRFLKNGWQNAGAFYDLNDDGYLDAIVGNYSGGVNFYYGKLHVSVPENNIETETALNIFPNPKKWGFYRKTTS